MKLKSTLNLKLNLVRVHTRYWIWHLEIIHYSEIAAKFRIKRIEMIWELTFRTELPNSSVNIFSAVFSIKRIHVFSNP